MANRPPHQSDRDLMPPPPRSRPPPLSHTLGGTTRPILLSDTELESSSDDDDGSASSTPHARARGLQDATQRMLDDLRSVVQGANYCCGGTIPTENFTTSTSSAETERNTASSITLRFDTPDGLVARIKFPNTAEIKPLSRVCSHPTFSSEGRGGLDASHFSTDFHPHDFGISDTIAQTLLPGVERLTKDEGTKKGEELWGVKTELRALNVCSPNFTFPISVLQLLIFFGRYTTLPLPVPQSKSRTPQARRDEPNRILAP
jgi:hypothetical protein